VGGGLSQERESLELRWRQIAEALVQSDVVEPAEVLHDGQLELRAGAPDASSVLKLSTKLSASALS
jgi:hypothetical protein